MLNLIVWFVAIAAICGFGFVFLVFLVMSFFVDAPGSDIGDMKWSRKKIDRYNERKLAKRLRRQRRNAAEG